MKALLAPLFFISLTFGIYSVTKEPLPHNPQIGDCYAIPLSLLVEKSPDGKYEVTSSSMLYSRVSFKIVDIRHDKITKERYILVQYFDENKSDHKLYKEIHLFPPEEFEKMKPVLHAFADFEGKMCNWWFK